MTGPDWLEHGPTATFGDPLEIISESAATRVVHMTVFVL
jgi:hypothetical protein